jgi:hypothetical protein
VFDHFGDDFLDNWVYSEGRAFQHRDVVVIINKIRLGRCLADGDSSVRRLDLLLLLVDLLFALLSLDSFFEVLLAQRK